MSGVSIPQGMQGIWGGTGSPVGYGGGSSANTIQAVKNAAGELKAYDPTTMAGTTKAPEAEAPKFAAAGMDTSGLPSYVTNWLAQGAQGAMPTASNMSTNPLGVGTTAAGVAAGGDLAKASKGFTGDDDAAWRAKNKTAIDAAAAASQPKTQTTTAAAAGQPTYTLIPKNAAGGYNQPGIQQPMAVGQFWNGSQEQTLAVPPVGGAQNAPQLMSAGVYVGSDGKYYSKDPSGKMTLVSGNMGGGPTGQPMQEYMKNFFKGFGY